MTGGVLEENLNSLQLKEGKDYHHFNWLLEALRKTKAALQLWEECGGLLECPLLRSMNTQTECRWSQWTLRQSQWLYQVRRRVTKWMKHKWSACDITVGCPVWRPKMAAPNLNYLTFNLNTFREVIEGIVFLYFKHLQTNQICLVPKEQTYM